VNHGKRIESQPRGDVPSVLTPARMTIKNGGQQDFKKLAKAQQREQILAVHFRPPANFLFRRGNFWFPSRA
jgi:hypothetical protein